MGLHLSITDLLSLVLSPVIDLASVCCFVHSPRTVVDHHNQGFRQISLHKIRGQEFP